ncbi:MAG: ATP-dependent helicase, partial [Clostridia bacterium]|nr:ATP-dependent helicase [Clostridia bacterium]
SAASDVYKRQTLQSFLSRLEELPRAFEANTQEAAVVTLTTLHSSKGLEYDTVLMVDLVNREIPGEGTLTQAREKEDAALEEERRLFYVGMTRSKTELYLVFPEKVNDRLEPRSTFINEVAALMSQEVQEQLGEGVVIRHKKYGRGVIAKLSEEKGRTTVHVDFKGVMGVFDLSVCLENGLMTFEQA